MGKYRKFGFIRKVEKVAEATRHLIILPLNRKFPNRISLHTLHSALSYSPWAVCVARKKLQNVSILLHSGSSNVLKRFQLQAILAEFLASEKSQIPDPSLRPSPMRVSSYESTTVVVIRIF